LDPHFDGLVATVLFGLVHAPQSIKAACQQALVQALNLSGPIKQQNIFTNQ
jgi:hypothetical protein